MKKFIVNYQAPIDATWKTQESTPKEMEEGMKAWRCLEVSNFHYKKAL